MSHCRWLPTGSDPRLCQKPQKKLLNGEIDHLLYEDESMIRDYQAIQKSWFVKGQQRVIQTYGKHEGVKLLGILNYETDKVYIEDHKS